MMKFQTGTLKVTPNKFVNRHFSKIIFTFLFACIFSHAGKAQDKTGQPIDIVFCLDLSSSSNGLIDQFRNHIWDYWYMLSQCQPQPNYRIAVVAYARFSYGKSTGYVKVIRDLGTDFERLSNILYKIPAKIEKGDQYVGAALNTCLKKISWSKDPTAKKVIFLVGNGDVTTGEEDIDLIIEKLVEQNVIINTIYCTAPGERKAIKGWEKIALKGRGKIETMSLRNRYFDKLEGFDMKRFRSLNRKFNNTYLFYGKGGRLRWNMLPGEDNHVYVANTEGYRYRTLYKISEDYQRKNYSWDLVDMYYKNPVAFMNVERKYLNDTCKKMSTSQLKSYIIYKKYERKKLSDMLAEMIANKKTDPNLVKNMPTLDLLSLKMIRDILKETGCECVYE